MKKNCLKRIKRHWQFKKLFRQGYRFTGRVLRVRYQMNSLGRMRLGFSVSAKRGNAVERNLFKRRLRQYSVEKEVSTGFDAVIIPTVQLNKLNWKKMLADMEELVKKTENVKT